MSQYAQVPNFITVKLTVHPGTSAALSSVAVEGQMKRSLMAPSQLTTKPACYDRVDNCSDGSSPDSDSQKGLGLGLFEGLGLGLAVGKVWCTQTRTWTRVHKSRTLPIKKFVRLLFDTTIL